MNEITIWNISGGYQIIATCDGKTYPMLLRKEDVAREMMKAIRHREHIRVIDWRWRIVTALWRRIPRWVWGKLKIKNE